MCDLRYMPFNDPSVSKMKKETGKTTFSFFAKAEKCESVLLLSASSA